MKISLGMITKDLLTIEPLNQFLDNAFEFKHKLHSIVIAYSDKIDEMVLIELRKRIDVHVVKINSSNYLKNKLEKLKMSEEAIKSLIGDISLPFDGRAPYGQSRNHVIIEAMLTASDVLLFIDTDVYPEVVIKKIDSLGNECRESGLDEIVIEKIDFIGRHLELLEINNVAITTSDYTGYYIIPPMMFSKMKELFSGLKKENAYLYIKDYSNHQCLSTDNGIHRKIFKTDKVLGGNVAIKLDVFKKIVPFFSTTYIVNGNKYLTRGEDTVLALQMKENKEFEFYDIDTKIFHNTYGHFPVIPDIVNDKNIKDRFFYASMGWIGRNPFLNYLNGEDVKERYEFEHKNLLLGSKEIADYLNDIRFLELPKAHRIAYENLESVKKEFELFKKSWREFILRIEGGTNEDTNT